MYLSDTSHRQNPELGSLRNVPGTLGRSVLQIFQQRLQEHSDVHGAAYRYKLLQDQFRLQLKQPHQEVELQIRHLLERNAFVQQTLCVGMIRKIRRC